MDPNFAGYGHLWCDITCVCVNCLPWFSCGQLFCDSLMNRTCVHYVFHALPFRQTFRNSHQELLHKLQYIAPGPLEGICLDHDPHQETQETDHIEASTVLATDDALKVSLQAAAIMKPATCNWFQESPSTPEASLRCVLDIARRSSVVSQGAWHRDRPSGVASAKLYSCATHDICPKQDRDGLVQCKIVQVCASYEDPLSFDTYRQSLHDIFWTRQAFKR